MKQLQLLCVLSSLFLSQSQAANVPFRLNEHQQPITLNMPDDLIPNLDVNEISKTITQWNKDSRIPRLFFSPEVKIYPNFAPQDLVLHYDGVVGVYFYDQWFPEYAGIPGFTILFGRKRNEGTPYEYFEIEHGDIILNTADYKFSMNPSHDEIDLISFITQKSGELLGLQKQRLGAQSVMAPLLSGVINRNVTTVDLHFLWMNYVVLPTFTTKNDNRQLQLIIKH